MDGITLILFAVLGALIVGWIASLVWECVQLNRPPEDDYVPRHMAYGRVGFA